MPERQSQQKFSSDNHKTNYLFEWKSMAIVTKNVFFILVHSQFLDHIKIFLSSF